LRTRAQLSRYGPLFERAGVSFHALVASTGDDDLAALGVAALGPRLRMLASLAAIRAGVGTSAAGSAEGGGDDAADAPPRASEAEEQARRLRAAAAAPARRITEFFVGGGSGVVGTQSGRRAPGAGGVFPSRAPRAALPAPRRAAAAPKAPKPKAPRRRAPRAYGGGGGGGGAADPSAPPPVVPPWQAVEGTPFIVDAFGASARHVSSGTWFLTHFHSDHYAGLSASWCRGVIVCTPVTAALVALRLRVPRAALRPLPLNARTCIDGVWVTLLDANHCPGAAMILFEPPAPAAPVLHTGDCRWDPGVMHPMLAPHLQSLRDRSSLRVILDTTYGCPVARAAFPPAADAAAFVAAAVAAEAFNPRTLFLFGTYTIGKERVCFAAARAAGRPLYAGAAKREVLDCLDLTPEERGLITASDAATNLHIAPMGAVSFARMKGVLAHYRGRFNTVVGFAPTGWAFARAASGAAKHGKRGGGKRTARGSLVRYDVPYSEHSSFEELRAAMRFLRPAAVCPSVANDQGPKTAAMVAALLAPEREGE
jgi:DNA cross-link repair 1A protein